MNEGSDPVPQSTVSQELTDRIADQVARALRSLGVRAGDPVVVEGAGQWPTLATALGALRLGTSVLALPPVEDPVRAAAVVAGLRPRLWCTSRPADAEFTTAFAPFDCQGIDVGDLLEISPSPPTAAREADLPGTSGSVLDSASRAGPFASSVKYVAKAASEGWSFQVWFDLPSRGRHLASAPFWHVDPLTVAIGALRAGHDVVLAADLHGQALWAECRRTGATSAFVVPAVLENALADVERTGRLLGLTSLISGIRPCPENLRRAAAQSFGDVLYETYKADGRRCLTTPRPSGVHRRVGIWSLAAAQADEAAVGEHDGRVVTRRELVQSARLLANGLAARGLQPGNVVAAALSNSADAVAAYLGAVLGGFAYLPIGIDLPLPRLRELCALHRPQVLLADEGGQTFPEVQAVAVRSLVVEGSSVPDMSYRGDGFMLALTSGSTGLPKAVRRRSGAMDATVRAVLESATSRLLEMPTEGVHLVTGPLSGGAFWSMAISALHSGQDLLLMRSWSPENALALIEQYRVTSSFLLPTMMAAMLRRHDEGEAHDLSSLRAVVHAAAPCPVELKRRMIDWLGPIVHEFYSTTEAGGTYVLAEEWLRRPGTVGKSFPGVLVRILAEDGTSLPPGEVGQVALGSGGYTVRGEGAAVVYEGAALPGDLGYLDEDGYLYLVGRESEILKVAGVKVHAREVEDVLRRHPAVLDAAVIGAPHQMLGECVVAFVEADVSDREDIMLERSILRLARDALPVAKAPRRLHLLDKLPRTPNGKTDRLALRKFVDASPC